MSSTAQTFRSVSDTAIWAAVYRARETERKDGLFRDPLARRLAGSRGDRIAAALKSHDKYEWAWVMRTVLFDRYVEGEVARGADLVVNLAAGLDTRPYRMTLAPALQWVEVDLPGILDEKEEILRGEKPVCALERVRLDLSDLAARRDLFARLGKRGSRALVITEGLLIYLDAAEVAALAVDLARPESFRRWALDISSPGLLRLLQREVGAELDRAAAPLKFGPPEGPEFFVPCGWRPVEVQSPLKAAARAKRVSLLFRLLALLPQSNGRQGNRPWSGICLLERRGS